MSLKIPIGFFILPFEINLESDKNTKEIILKYRPQISKAYQSYDSFEIDNSIKIKNGGYWISPIGQADFPESTTGKPKLTHNAEVAHYTFLELDSPLKENVEYTIKTPLGELVKFTYPQADGNKIIKIINLI